MKVSVIINCYNSEKFLRATIESVLNQTYKNFELIIYDDASSDNTKDIALSYGNKLIFYRTEIRYPLGKARNEALKYATGELITYLDHDDLLINDSLEKRVKVFKSNKKIALVF
ncbi:MAG TPA: glycosyltransferase family A protein, partial [bacterium]|nr:glycosyltransferase family A protein [bacterium]